MMEEYSGEAKPHALFVAYPFQGHFSPSANLAVLLAARGFIVTFVTTEAFHQQLLASRGTGADVFAGARSRGLDIRHELVSDGRLQFPDKDERPLHDVIYALLHLMAPHVEQLMIKLSAAAGGGDLPVDVLVADSYFVWPSTLAKRFGIPYVSFWTEPALVFALFYHLPLLLPPPEDRTTATITHVPGVPAIEPRDLVSYFHTPEASSLTLQMIEKAFDEAKAADFVLCNTVEELEAGTVAAVQEYYSGARFYSIGPIMDFAGGAVSTSIFPETDCSRWLDAMPLRSVLYISFGSIVRVSKRDLNEIAGGVLSSGVRFLWILRPGSDHLPEGFEEASHRGRGLLVPWCQQREVLLHPAVGGFLTHCGWNSVLESMWCGVPMLCFPMAADQPTNRKLVVDVRAGIDIGGAGEVGSAEVAKAIDGLMGGEVRKEMEGVRKVLASAVAPDGSSSRNITRFVEDLTRDLSEKKILLDIGPQAVL